MIQLMRKHVLNGVLPLQEKMEMLDHVASDEPPEDSKVHWYLSPPSAFAPAQLARLHHGASTTAAMSSAPV